MTNAEKAREIAELLYPYNVNEDNCEHYVCYEATIQMAEWKDEQFAKEKQKLINEACEWLAINDSYAIPTNVQVDRLREYLNNIK